MIIGFFWRLVTIFDWWASGCPLDSESRREFSYFWRNNR